MDHKLNILSMIGKFFIKEYGYRKHQNIALHRFNGVYFYIPKNACSSLKVFYSDALGLTPPKPKEPHKLPHRRDFPYIDREKIDDYDKYFKFTFVRNPWDRLVSCYHNKIKRNNVDFFRFRKGIPIEFYHRYGDLFFKDMTFEEFVEAVSSIPDSLSDPHFKSQASFITKNNKIIVDYIGKVENLEVDLNYINMRLGIDKDRVPPHLLKSSRSDYRDYYDSYTKQLVEERYHRDIELFKYEYYD